MEIVENRDNGTLTLELDGRLDALAALELDKKLQASLKDVKKLYLDFAKVPYIASAGVRVIVQAQKTMEQQGSMTLRHVNKSVLEVFEITRLVKFLKIEE